MAIVPTQGKSSVCQAGEICMDKEECPEFTAFQNGRHKMTNVIRKVEALKLKRKICNKKPDRLCCLPNSCRGNKKSYPKTFLPMKDQCGVSCSGSKSVVKGEDAVLGEFPWAALVGSEKVLKSYDNRNKQWVRKSYTVYHCGGTLINTWFVLTAAHCQKSNTKIIEVVIGEWNVLTDPDCTQDDENCDNPKVQKQRVANVIIHSGYDRSKNINDIALVKMKKQVLLNRFVQFACLPLPEYNLPNYFHNPEYYNATVVGWGKTSNDRNSDYEVEIKIRHGVQSPKLQKGQVQIHSISKCQEAFSRYPITVSNNICAGGYPGFTDSCKGDSGGGLFVDSGDYLGQSQGNVHVQIGMVGYGAVRLCGDSPSVYTKVEHFIPWIRKNLV